MSHIPKHITDHHAQGVEQLRFYGFAAAELDRDELLAMVNVLAGELKEMRERLFNHRRKDPYCMIRTGD